MGARKLPLCQEPVGAVPAPGTLQEAGWLTQAGMASATRVKLQGQLGLGDKSLQGNPGNGCVLSPSLCALILEAITFPTQALTACLYLFLSKTLLSKFNIF